MRRWLEFAAAWCALKALGLLPRALARAAGSGLARGLLHLRPSLRRTAMQNLHRAFPEWSDAQRRATIREVVRQAGWMAGEFSQFPRYTRQNIESVVVLDGFENFDAAQRKGKGVLFLTGHVGAWELAPFAQALYGFPLHFLVRPLDNARVDALINGYRTLSGNQPIEKNRAARAMLSILAEGGTIGVLIDQNASREEGVFVPFFGIPACTTSGLARIAQRTSAPVVPGFLYWDAALRKYRLRFEPEIPLVQTGDETRDIVENTARFTLAVEEQARRRPDQWLWVHKRWKTRPEGEPPFYSR